MADGREEPDSSVNTSVRRDAVVAISATPTKRPRPKARPPALPEGDNRTDKAAMIGNGRSSIPTAKGTVAPRTSSMELIVSAAPITHRAERPSG